MKIWLDLRFLWDNIYSRFVSTLVENMIKNSPDNKFIIYANSNLNLLKTENSIVKKVDIKGNKWSYPLLCIIFVNRLLFCG